MGELIPYGRQSIDEDDIAAVADVLRSDFLTTGPAVRAFEADLEAETGARFARVLSSGTAALHAAYSALGFQSGDEIIMPPLTFAATANAALYVGARPVFVDVDADTGNIDPSLAEAAITSRTKAIVAVDYAGHPADYDALRSVSSLNGLLLVADAAHSLGAGYHGVQVGRLADASILSFHPVKAVTSGEGGAVLTDDPEIAGRVTQFRTHGVTREPERMVDVDGPWSYEVQSLGFNYRLTDIHAALGRSQLTKLEGFVARRQAIARRYTEAFADLPLTLPTTREGIVHAWHLYVVRSADRASRRRLFDDLRARGLGVQVHYRPVYQHPLYRDLGYEDGQCPRAEAFYGAAISLPLFPAMTDHEVQRVIDIVRATTLAL